jgi:hypothetical protein
MILSSPLTVLSAISDSQMAPVKDFGSISMEHSEMACASSAWKHTGRSGNEHVLGPSGGFDGGISLKQNEDYDALDNRMVTHPQYFLRQGPSSGEMRHWKSTVTVTPEVIDTRGARV